MRKNTAYKIAKYTSWIALLLNFVFLVYLYIKDSEAAVWYLFIAGFLFIIPWILFLIALWVSKKWKNIEKPTIITFLIASILFGFFAVYLIFANNSYQNNIEWVMIAMSVITIAESLNILFAKK